MAPNEDMPITVSLTIKEAMGIIGDLDHMIRLNRATSQQEQAAWGRARPGAMRKLARAIEAAGWKATGPPDDRSS